MNNVKALVSKKKKRFVDERNGFNLDLSYIGGPDSQLIAMGYPAAGVEALYRNSMSEVQRFFHTFHENNYAVYNLCSERVYDLTQFFPLTYRFGFDDHQPPPLEMMRPFCESVGEYLNEDPKHFAAIHCKAGKGRTGVMVSAFLVHSGRCGSAEEALLEFSRERTKNRKGVTIPSQQRFVHYYEQLLRRGSVTAYTYCISHVRMVGVPNHDTSILGGGCQPFFEVSLSWYSPEDGEAKSKTIYNYKKHVRKLRHFKREDKFVDLDVSSHDLLVAGNVRIRFYDRDRYSQSEMCQFWLHTGFIESNYLCFEKSVIDKACKDKEHKRFDPNFRIEIYLHKVDKRLVASEMVAVNDDD
mmetsp:Transcript_17548/g.34517  ORF Transcript_17548/g.34517 Transcript_17548/m.34517 type:complete len:355 (+) Transcript_17548:268-1332(+)